MPGARVPRWLENFGASHGEPELRTVLVTTGSTRPEDIETFPYRPTRVVDSIADLVSQVRPITSG